MQRLKVFGADWCHDTQRVRYVLSELHVPYDYVNVDEEPDALDMVRRWNFGRETIPDLVFEGELEPALVEPTTDDLISELEQRGFTLR